MGTAAARAARARRGNFMLGGKLWDGGLVAKMKMETF